MYDRERYTGEDSATLRERVTLEERLRREQCEADRSLTGGVGSAIGSPNVQRSEIARTLDEQEKTLHVLMQQVEVLATRLRPVLMPDTPTAIGADKMIEQGYGTQIATCVANNTRIATTVGARLTELTDRLAL